MFIERFPGCCTAKVLCDLGGSSTSEYEESEFSAEDLEEKFSKILSDFKKITHEHMVHVYGEEYDSDDFESEDYGETQSGNGIIVATTTTEQETANEFLKSKGFFCAGPYRKIAHPETGLFLWWLPIHGMWGDQG